MSQFKRQNQQQSSKRMRFKGGNSYYEIFATGPVLKCCTIVPFIYLNLMSPDFQITISHLLKNSKVSNRITLKKSRTIKYTLFFHCETAGSQCWAFTPFHRNLKPSGVDMRNIATKKKPATLML